MNNVIGSTSSFQNGLNELFSSTGLCLTSKAIEGVEIMFFNFWAPFFKMNIFEVVIFFLN